MSSIDYLNISQKDFENLLDHLSDEYHNGISSVSDDFFDSLLNIYFKRFNKKYSKIGHAVNHKNKVKLPYCMPSLGKILTENEINTWLSKFNSEIFVVSDKVDGISLLIHCQNQNVKLFTRGDGIEGRDVSYFLPYIGVDTILKKIKNSNITIRGELVLPIEKFNKKYKNKFSNPRNTVSGAIVSKDFDISILKDCLFVAYEIYGSNKTRYDDFEFLTLLGFRTPFYMEINKRDISFKKLEEFINKRRTISEYEMDGLVLSTNKVFDDKTKKNNCEYPKDYIAFKIKGEKADAIVEYVEWNLSKNGLFKPRIKIQPITIGGVTINYTTGFNAKFIVENKIGKGSIVVITRSGDVIPYILDVKKEGELILPSSSIWNESGIELIYDENTSQNINEEIIISQFVYAFKELNFKNLAKGNITKLVEAGFNSIFKLLKIKRQDLLQIEGFKDKTADIILSNIENLKLNSNLLDWMIVSCLFPSFGRKKLELIVTNIPEFLSLKDEDLLKKLNLIGFNKTALTFIEYLPKFKEFLKQIKQMNIEIKDTNKIKEENKTNEFEGIVVVFTGVRNEELKNKIENGGGKVVSAFSSKVNLVITNDINGNSSTLKKARENNTEIKHINEMINV